MGLKLSKEGCEDTRSWGIVTKRCQVNMRVFLTPSQIWKRNKKRPPLFTPPPPFFFTNSFFGSAKSYLLQGLKLCSKLVRMLDICYCYLWIVHLFVFLFQVAEDCLLASQLPLLRVLCFLPLRAPFTASRHWSMAPSSWEEPLQGKEARRTWAYRSLIL